MADDSTPAPLASLLLPVATQRPRVRYAWRGPSLLVVDERGEAGTEPLTGYFFRQGRFLSRLQLRIMDERPHLCSIAEIAPNVLELTFIHPEVTRGGGGGSGSGGLDGRAGLLFRNLDLCLRCVVHPASLDVTLRITSRWQDALDIDVAWLLDADYASSDEAQFGVREQSAPVAASPFPNGVSYGYAHPELPFETRVHATGREWRYDTGRLWARLHLEAQQTRQLSLRVSAIDALDPLDDEEAARREARLERWYRDVVTFHAPGESPLVEIANRASVDLGAIISTKLLAGRTVVHVYGDEVPGFQPAEPSLEDVYFSALGGHLRRRAQVAA